MASIISHVAIPITARLAGGKATVPTSLLICGMLASILPDFDVISFKLGIAYHSPFGHRGFTHSIAFALFIGILGTCFYRAFNCSKIIVFSVLFLSTLSHALLDALTNGGLGVAFFWPLDNTRYFFPHTPIQVSPIGVKNFISERGLNVLISEAKYIWAPCLGISFLLRFMFSKK